MLRSLVCITVSGLLIGCGNAQVRRSIEEGPQESAQGVGNDSGFHSLLGWQASVPYYISSQAPDNVVEAAQDASDTWSDTIGRVVLRFSGIAASQRGGDLYKSLDDDATFVYYETQWTATTAKSPTTLATTIWENADDSDRIVRGDVILNAETYTFLDAKGYVPRDVDRNRVVDAETVLLHEFGHLLGLDHISEAADPDSIMHAQTFIGASLSFRVLSAGDSDRIKQLYP